MKRITIPLLAILFALGLFAVANYKISTDNIVKAQNHEQTAAPQQEAKSEQAHKPRCTNRNVSGTYGYHMNGSIIGVGSFLVNGIFTITPEGTSTANVRLMVNGQNIPATGVDGSYTMNDDCTSTGTFKVPELNLQITYSAIYTDDGSQVFLINTNPGIVLQGQGRRIAVANRVPHCDDRMIIGDYGYRLEGSLPGVPAIATVGLVTHLPHGRMFGFDAASFNGSQVPRRDYQGTYKLNSDCTGTGNYKDSLGSTVNYVFTVVDEGKEIYLQGANGNGDNVFGVGRRVH